MPVTIIIYKLIPNKARQTAFIVISMVFLAVSDIISAVGIIITAFIVAGYGRFSVMIRRKKIIFLALTITLMLLYAGSFVGWSIYNSMRFENAHSFLRFCPIGTSFFFLQVVRFTADIYTGKIKTVLSINDSFEYLLFYPRLVMGPVMTYDEHIKMITNSKQNSENIGYGLELFIRGLSKKLLLADAIGMIFSPLYGVINNDATLLMSWLTVLAFALELYFTVAGYGDMAKGIALCYGFNIPQSYKYPLFSGSMSRFSDEWNISVVSWCKSCVSPMLRSNKWQSIIGMIAAWLILGFWYRPQRQIIIWGAWIGFWIGIDRYLKRRFTRIPSVIYGIVFFIVTFLGWAFFSADSVAGGIKMVGLLLGSNTIIARSQDFYYLRSAGVVLIIAIYSATGNFGALIARVNRIPIISKVISLFAFLVQILLLILCIVMLVTHNDIAALQLKGAM